MESRNSMYSDFLKTNRSNFLMKSARICQNPEDKEKRRSSFNSVYELTKNGQDAWTSNDWNKNHYRFDVPDRKQEYYALENFTNDLINTKARNHQYRNPKPERPIVNQSFDVIRVSFSSIKSRISWSQSKCLCWMIRTTSTRKSTSFRQPKPNALKATIRLRLNSRNRPGNSGLSTTKKIE
jgi:hypothetical protein